MSEKDFSWISTDAELREFCDAASPPDGTVIPAFIDTEADSLHHYQEKLCLFQLAIGNRFALIDPLAIADMRPLLSLLEKCDLWLHGADYDLTLLKRSYEWTPPRFFDTQIASRLAGHRAFGLAALVLHYTGVTLCKSSQKEDWSQRPLSEKMQAYAVDDVRYLPELSSRLMDELRAAGRVEWFEESCETLRSDVLARQVRDREEAWRISGAGKFRPAGLALLREMWRWREGMASERDVPPFRILNNQQMLTMAADWEQQGRVNIPNRWRGRWRTSFEEILNGVKNSDPQTWPERPKKLQRRCTDEERTRIDNLCRARDAKANALGLEPSLLGSRAVMEDLVLNQASPQERLMRWQIEVLGDALELVQPTRQAA
ncbi:hypothetical protein FEM03_05335 [Phragmitibacter flavus]|uniref:3'-5' exonuclease domain-containing protein n=1 Tax=Phragmitibacter flavus TaxID=2576071 RepID=A0A5R8KGY3_9BACT|nr:ribonuclease D [Phragmitibacter flavus]TLD71568.1 hypothetical protein FEM03_05335 [Phragmitibacter flavus]